MTIYLHLFGRPRMALGDTSADLPFERRHQLLAYLAAHGGWIGRAQLAALLWPTLPATLANANLRKTLFRIQPLPWAELVEISPEAVRSEPASDLRDFDAALREGRPADALRLGGDQFLQGFEDGESQAWNDWLAFERERLRGAWRGLALRRLGETEDAAEAVELSSRMLAADPIDEDALRAHMRWLARAGQVAGARRAYREFVERLQQDFGLAPGAELRALHDALGGPAAEPARAVAPDDDFVGRAGELRQLGELLADPSHRLVTIVGPGGVGKTRLARRALQEFGSRWPDGARFVSLEAASTAADAAAALAHELDASGPGEPLARVLAWLHEHRPLLVLDNLEQVEGGAALVQQLLDACDGLQLLATSRLRLGLRAEWALPLEGLPCPDAEDGDRLESFDAARLFVRSARRVEPALVPAAEAGAIIEICSIVEGLPLALELAAAWTRVLSCAAIAGELRQGTQLLRTQDPSWPERHGSMELVFEQSWALLNAHERDALARLSVFRGGFTADAARQVAGASLPVLASLVDKSLLRKDGQRLQQHPLIQQLSALRLDAAQQGAVQAAHARYFHALLAHSRPAIERGDGDALARLDAEFDNCRAAWHWSATHGDGAALVGSLPGLRGYCEFRARLQDGLGLLQQALEAFPSGAVHAHLLTSRAQMEYRLDRYGDAMASAGAALAIAKSQRIGLLRFACCQVLGTCELRLGRHDAARRHFQQALEHVPPEQPRMNAVILDTLALVEKRAGRYHEALEMSLRALEEFRRLGYMGSVALCLNNLGALENELGDAASAGQHLREALELCQAHGFVGTRGLVLGNLAQAALRLGELDEARTRAEAMLELARSTDNRAQQAWAQLMLARVALARSDLAAARTALRSATELANAIGQPALQVEAMICFGELLAAQGEASRAAEVLQLALSHEAATASHRKEADALLARWHIPLRPPPKSVGFTELAHRIASEAPLGHAPLLQVLRGGP